MVSMKVQKPIAYVMVGAMSFVAFGGVMHGNAAEIVPPVQLIAGSTAPTVSLTGPVIVGHQSAISHEFYHAPANPQALPFHGLTFPSS